MNLKFNDKFREQVLGLHNAGYTTNEIADLVGISRKSAWYIIDRYSDSKYDNGIDKCSYCNSNKTVVARTRMNHPYKKGTEYYVVCRECHARGPMITILDDSNLNEDSVIGDVIDAWNWATTNHMRGRYNEYA